MRAPPTTRLLLILAVVALLGAGCRVELAVDVTMAADGSGEVGAAVLLDEAAASRLPDLADQLDVDDLLAAGWVVTGPEVEADGRTAVRATRAFATPEEADLVLDQLTGADGPFGDLRVGRTEGSFRTTYRLEGVVDLGDGVDGFADDALRDRLDGTSLGLDVAELERRAGTTIEEAVRVQLTATLPATGGRAPTARWSPMLGEVTAVETSSDVRNTGRIAWTAAALAAAVLAAAVALAGARRRR